METQMQEQQFTSDVFDKQTWRKVFQLLWLHKKQIIPLMCFNIMLALSDVGMPLLNRYALDHYAVQDASSKTLPIFITVYACMIVIQCILVYLFFRLAARVESDFGKQLRQKCFIKLQEQTFAYFDHHANGWLMTRITSDTARLAEVLAWSFVDIAWGMFTMLGICVVMFVVNWKMALVVLCSVPLLWGISLYFQRRILKSQRKTRKENSKITAAVTEGINGAMTSKTLAIEEDNHTAFQEKTQRMYTYSMRGIRLNAIFQPLVYLLSGCLIAGLVTIGGYQVIFRVIQFGTLAMFVNYANLFFDPLKQIARLLTEIQMAQASAERVIALLEEDIEIQDETKVLQTYGTLLAPKIEKDEPLVGHIMFDHVDFYYHEAQPVLHAFTMEALPGETIALVGETGSGKSTVVNLLCRFYEPKGGNVYIDGMEYRKRSVGWLHSHIGYVLQTPCLFSGTIKENIRYGRPQASDEEVIHVAKQIHAHDFIMRMEHGYDSEVGEGGDRLSTGQKQLISFARAIVAQPSIVILDEATSSIDTESEKNIQLAMQALLKNRTAFVVAHRLSTIVHADKILVMQKGRIVEQGTHTDLLKQNGYYHELYTSQYMKEKEREWSKI